jgi:hypothetical protein
MSDKPMQIDYQITGGPMSDTRQPGVSVSLTKDGTTFEIVMHASDAIAFGNNVATAGRKALEMARTKAN